MDVGVVAIRGLSSNYYLAISKKGELYGAVSSRVIQVSVRSANQNGLQASVFCVSVSAPSVLRSIQNQETQSFRFPILLRPPGASAPPPPICRSVLFFLP